MPATTGKRSTVAEPPVPVLSPARLAMHRDVQDQGLGKGLLQDALSHRDQAVDIAGIRTLLVHAKADRARAVYTRFDFDPSPSDPAHLFLLLKDLRISLQRSAGWISRPRCGVAA
jgi:GNAT superfamily N-acetyltransferase